MGQLTRIPSATSHTREGHKEVEVRAGETRGRVQCHRPVSLHSVHTLELLRGLVLQQCILKYLKKGKQKVVY